LCRVFNAEIFLALPSRAFTSGYLLYAASRQKPFQNTLSVIFGHCADGEVEMYQMSVGELLSPY
jgi:hypothetical protein